MKKTSETNKMMHLKDLSANYAGDSSKVMEIISAVQQVPLYLPGGQGYHVEKEGSALELWGEEGISQYKFTNPASTSIDDGNIVIEPDLTGAIGIEKIILHQKPFVIHENPVMQKSVVCNKSDCAERGSFSDYTSSDESNQSGRESRRSGRESQPTYSRGGGESRSASSESKSRRSSHDGGESRGGESRW